MIQQSINEKQSHDTIGGFIAKSADPILAHVNPSRLQEKDLVISIQVDQSIIVSFAHQQDQTNWTTLSREQVHQSKNLLALKIDYFKILQDDYTGIYSISTDFTCVS